jgi:hypothetical protein
MPPLDCLPTTSQRPLVAPLAGQTVLVVIDAPNGATPFADARKADRAAEVLAEPGRWGDALLLCWVILPAEVRLMLRVGEKTAWPTLLFDVWQAAVARGSLPGFGVASPRDDLPGTRSYVLGREDDLLAIANHVLRQPVRAGLAKDLDDYRWWGAPWRRRIDATSAESRPALVEPTST